MQYQLRRYQLVDGAADDFVAIWKSAVVPLRKALGFEIVGAWIVEESNEFVWIIGHENLAEASEAYYASPERQALDPSPAEYLTNIHETMMTSVPQA